MYNGMQEEVWQKAASSRQLSGVVQKEVATSTFLVSSFCNEVIHIG